MSLTVTVKSRNRNYPRICCLVRQLQCKRGSSHNPGEAHWRGIQARNISNLERNRGRDGALFEAIHFWVGPSAGGTGEEEESGTEGMPDLFHREEQFDS